MIRIQDNTESGYAKELNQISNNKMEKIHTVTVDCNYSNFLNLQFLFLWLQKHNLKCNLNITYPDDIYSTNENMADRARISSFLSCKDVNRYILNPKKLFGKGFQANSLQSMDNISLNKVLPLLEINEQTFYFFSGFVHERFASTIENGNHFFVVEQEYTDENKQKRTYIRFKEMPDEFDPGGSAETVYRACSNYLFRKGDLNTVPFYERVEYFQSPLFYEKVKDLSVLAFLIFCAYDKILAIGSTGQKPPRQRDEEIDEIILNVLDISDGLLQLIENVVFHGKADEEEYGRGFLSFRIHENRAKENQDSTYLSKQYHEYFDGGDNRYAFINGRDIKSNDLIDEYRSTPPTSREQKKEYDHIWDERNKRKEVRANIDYFLEIRLSDYSGTDICTSFLQQLRDGTEKSVFSDKLSLEMFFSPTREEMDTAWRTFYYVPDNAVHHYGLQLFDALLKGNDGCFIAQSCSDLRLCDEKRNLFTTSGDRFANKNEAIFPGTKYAILLPFLKRREYSPSFVNTNINYSLSKLERHYRVCSRMENPQPTLVCYLDMLNSGEIFTAQEAKTKRIAELFAVLNRFRPDPFEIILFDGKELNLYNMEIFAKSLMLYIGNNKDLIMNFAISNCDSVHFTKLARLFAVFYDRNGNNNFMGNVQLYLAGKESKDEFLISGTNLKAALVAQIKLSAARGISGGIPSKITHQLIHMLSRFPGTGHNYGPLAFVPFDLLIKNEQGLTIFEQNALDVLQTDIQDSAPGCKISPNHMRIGSKIHIDAFYEAETLFYNNYYTTRYAYLLSQMIARQLAESDVDQHTYLLLISYETYSEIMIRELCKFFMGYADYCIFEYGTTNRDGEKYTNKFRHIESIDLDKEYHPIYIVPINSTLSTFNKLEAEFIKNHVNVEGDQRPIRLINQPMYFGVIQVRDSGGSDERSPEHSFFADVDVSNRVIVSKLLTSKPVHYINLVSCGWYSPLDCPQCYPANYFNELPLVETDKSSVIPSQLFGKHNQNRKPMVPNSANDRTRIKRLEGHLMYGHVSRNANHFAYYIKTEEFFINNAVAIEQWLEDEVKKGICPASDLDAIIRYDIVICPAHFSNPSFVKSVNDKVFGGASLVIGIDSNKEFRDNFIAKHSDLRSLYQSLSDMGTAAEINFHFVDDTIIQGSTYLRIRSMLYSLFPDYDFTSINENTIKIRIFDSIIVLLNRLSGDSKKNFILNTGRFFNYLGLNISSMRTHDNACVMCKEAADLDLLAKSCSIERLAHRFREKHKLALVQDFSKYKLTTSEEKGFLRMLCSHELQSTFKQLENINDKHEVFRKLVEKIRMEILELDKKHKRQRLDVLISYLTVAATPFLSFRKSIHEASFDLIIILLETVLYQPPGKMTDAKRRDAIICLLKEGADQAKAQLLDTQELQYLMTLVMDIIRKDTKAPETYIHECNLLRALIKLSTVLKSSYLIRGENIVRIVSRSANSAMDKHGYTLAEYYLYNIKKLLTIGSDEAKSAFLEHLLLSGVEYPSPEMPTILLPGNQEHIGAHFCRKNPYAKRLLGAPESKKSDKQKAVADFIQTLYLENTKILYDAALDLSAVSRSTDEYYLKNFKEVLRWNRVGCEEKRLANALQAIQAKLADEPKDIKIYYSELADQISELLTVFAADCKNPSKSEAPYVFFLTGTKEYVLRLHPADAGAEGEQLSLIASGERKVVRSTLQDIAQCFAQSILPKNAAVPSFDDLIAEFHKSSGKSAFSDGLIKNQYCMIDFSNNVDAETKKPSIYLVIKYPDHSGEFQILRSFRTLLMFRDRISQRIKADFNSNLLQHELQIVETQKQLRKARSGYHADSNDSYNPEGFASGQFLGISTPEDFHYGLKEAVYTFFVNTVIGRINTKVIPPHEGVENWSDDKYTMIEKNLASITNISRSNTLVLVDGAGKEIAPSKLEDFFADLFRARIPKRNTEDKLPYHIYVTAFIAELVSSAVHHGKAVENRNRVGIELDDSGYFWISNEVEADFDQKELEESLARKGQGIGLPTICGYFELFHRNADGKTTNSDLVHICLPNMAEGERIIKIGLPLFNERIDKRNEKMLSDRGQCEKNRQYSRNF